jgi:hypothetical protein
MDEFLKGNFKIKNEVTESAISADGKEQNLKGKLRKAALHTIGGSMVYMERNMLSWQENEPE